MENILLKHQLLVCIMSLPKPQIQKRDSYENAKINVLKEKEHKEKIEDLKGQKDIWGSQIRSYVFCPYTMVKDHRTNYEVGNVRQ